jgi:hypothetical protein
LEPTDSTQADPSATFDDNSSYYHTR